MATVTLPGQFIAACVTTRAIQIFMSALKGQNRIVVKIRIVPCIRTSPMTPLTVGGKAEFLMVRVIGSIIVIQMAGDTF